ncbi:MAG: (d)CMP kinase [Chloroflexi bacterium]|nr:MAG: (d)CMP kinase [Chloroflexota bacterium]
MLKPAIITIDGPAASGKSTLGALLAKQLGYTYFDTGVLYRALTYLALAQGIAPDDVPALVRLAEQMNAHVEPPTLEDGRQYTVTADGQDITWAIREPEVERHVSAVSAHPAVRTALREQQRVIGRRGRVVMVGRDIGNVVMPDADFKIFLLASAEERARRRHHELISQGREASFEQVFEDLRRRDALDAQNTLQPADAYIVNSDGLSPADIVGKLCAVLEQRARG